MTIEKRIAWVCLYSSHKNNVNLSKFSTPSLPLPVTACVEITAAGKSRACEFMLRLEVIPEDCAVLWRHHFC